MSLIATGFIDPKDYPFKKFIDEQKHLDTDELRHTIKTVHHHIDQDFKGEEHLYCDKSQLSAEGKFRRPKILVEAERRGFKTALEMYEADKKTQEDAISVTITAQATQLTAQAQQIAELTSLVNQLLKK